jgi:hypothetical protein
MTISAQSIIKTAQELLQDPDGIRWPATELVAHLNDGQRETATLRPDLFVITAPMSINGVKHTLPVACINLEEISRNTSGAPIRLVDRSMLDSVEPGWMIKNASKVIKHYCYDSREPDAFYSYPPAAAGASVDLVYSFLPTDVAAPNGASYSTVTGNINCKDICKAPLLHFVLFRAYSKDAEFGGNAALAQSHYARFTTGLQADSATGQAVKPTVTN